MKLASSRTEDKPKTEAKSIEEEIEREEAEEKRRELERLRLERLKAKLESEIAKYKGEAHSQPHQSGSPSSPAAVIISELVRQGVKPEQVDEFLKKLSPEALAALSSLSASNPYLPFFVYMISQAKGSQSITAKDVVDLSKSLVEAAKEFGPKGGESAMKELVDYLKERVSKLEDSMSKRGLSLGDIIDGALEDEKKLELLRKILGPSDPELQLKLEELRHRRMIDLYNLKLRYLELKRDMMEARRKRKMMADAFKRVLRAAARALEEEGARAEEATSKPVEAKRPGQSVVHLKCEGCGAEFPVAPDAKAVACPKCGAKYER